MTTKIEFIALRSYNLIGSLDDEQDCLESFLDKSGYICDAISETADNYIPIYNGDIWENASNISEDIEDAIAEGFAPTDSRDVDLMRIFQAGYYVHYQRSLYDNLDTLTFNYIANRVNEYLNTLDDISVIDISEIEDEIESETDGYDNNNTFDDMDDFVNSIIERIDNEEFVA